MSEESKLSKLRLVLITAAIAAGVTTAGAPVLADDGVVSEKDMMTQAVELYEKLSGETVSVPDAIAKSVGDEALGKAVVLGFTNADELGETNETTGLRKQDALTVLYKTIIDFDDNFALPSDEVDKVMNKCYDNALVDEENRAAYAFFLKHGIIDSGYNTEPNKEITWNSCGLIIDQLYNRFVQNISFDVNGTAVKIGANIESVTDVLGEPDRIDKGDFEFDWYVYNSDYNNFMMIGVEEGRICSFFSNAKTLSFSDLKVGDSYYSAYKILEDENYTVFKNKSEKIDGVLYNPFHKSATIAEVNTQVRAFELADMINAHRVSEGIPALNISKQLIQEAQAMAEQPKYLELAKDAKVEHYKDGAEHEISYDSITLYRVFVENGTDILDKNNNIVGIGTIVDENYSVEASIIAKNSKDVEDTTTVATTAEGLIAIMPEPTAVPTEEPTAEPTAIPTEIPTEAPPEETATATATETASTTPVVATSAVTTSKKALNIQINVPSLSAAQAVATETPATAEPEIQTVAPTETETETETEVATEQPTEEVVEKTDEEKKAEKDAAENSQGDVNIISPAANSTVASDKDLVIELSDKTADQYYVQIYSIEDDEYIVNSYIKPEDNKLVFEKSLFTTGKDYTISVIAITEEAASVPTVITVGYGEAPDEAVKITAFEDGATIDDDYINLTWDSELYHDFIIDVYDEEGKILLAQNVSDSNVAKISNIEPGTYTIGVTAVRRGNEYVTKAETKSTVEIVLPEPVLTEYILEDGEKFYPVYEDEELGLVYFYDEDIIDVEITDSDGNTKTVKRKKLTEKQVKATEYYKSLANAQPKLECFTGSDKKDTPTDENGMSFTYSNNTAMYSSDIGNAIVAEAQKYLGIPYVWGGTTTSGFDCSGLCQYVYRQLGINISRVSQTQYLEGTPISRENLQPGDLVFFESGGDVHHVGIYAGNGMMIHAPYTGTVVQYQSLDTPHYASQFCGGKRIYQSSTK